MSDFQSTLTSSGKKEVRPIFQKDWSDIFAVRYRALPRTAVHPCAPRTV